MSKYKSYYTDKEVINVFEIDINLAECNEFKEFIPYLSAAVIHFNKYYPAYKLKPFKYCPWCGKEIINRPKEITVMRPSTQISGIFDEYNYISCKSCEYLNSELINNNPMPILHYICQNPERIKNKIIGTNPLIETPEWCPILKKGGDARALS